MQYKHATLLLFIIFIGTGILTVAVFERRAALEEAQELAAIVINNQDEEQELPALFGNQYRGLSIDLNGDGTSDSVVLTIKQDRERGTTRTLSVNDAQIEAVSGNPQMYFGIIDLNTDDGIKELALSDIGPSSDPTTEFYRFDGTQLIKIGSTQGLYENMTFDGAGMLTTETRATMLDTWFYSDDYRLNAEGMLEHVDKPFYERLGEMNTVTLLGPVEFRASPVDSAFAFSSITGDVVTVIGCDAIEWCKVQNSDGLEGWFSATATSLNLFEGLSYAD